ncbi:MAG: adenosylcobalamin-dependent ribonucleoside-diphosphate reductase, partial [Nanoarchaeota archaeon]|nr:adenosylcobalamin-dependent ribonucleoside-diphosphate reductase [Nanoarchaeota archaeon]
MNTSKKEYKVASIKKRDGKAMPFQKEKITSAIFRAMAGLGMENEEKANAYADRVVEKIKETVKGKEIPTVEGIQDLVEQVLIEAGEVRIARAYITYREKRTEVRNEKKQILEKDAIDEVDKSFDVNSLRVLKSRYLERDEEGRLAESPKDLFLRVAIHAYLASVLYDNAFFRKRAGKNIHPEEDTREKELAGNIRIGSFELNMYHVQGLKLVYDRLNRDGNMKYTWSKVVEMVREGNFSRHEKGIQRFYDMMWQKKFLPNTPALANFGRSLGMGSACFVLGIEDSMEDIMATLQNAAFIFKAGGGVGYNFSNLRPEGDRVRSTSGTASGPISFMSLFDKMTEVIKQGGIRRGANMGILNSNHPDIEKFITAKEGNKALRNFNISILLMDDFWQHYEKNTEYPLINPRTKKVERTISARTLFDLIAYQAWESAEPGVIFADRVNEWNPFLKSLGPIVTTNPCGEVLLYPNESCNLGSVNVHAFVKRNGDRTSRFDWEGMKEAVMVGVEFLDNVIDVNNFPLPAIEEMTRKTRKIGLGVMGVADALFAMRIPYDSKEGMAFMERLMQFVNYWSKAESVLLARVRGSFPLYKESFFTEGRMPFAGSKDKESWDFDWKEMAEKIKKEGLRNSYTTVIAPTGSISMIAGTSSGIEPVFSLVYEKNVAVGNFYYIDPEFEIAMKEFGIYDEELLKTIVAHHGSLQSISYLPKEIKSVFRVAHDL